MTIEEFVQSFTEAVDFPVAVDITSDSVISQLEYWDSLAQLGVIVMFDVQFGKTITADDIARCPTVADLYKLTEGLVGA